jgi:phosphinothricin acetyltransferase
MSNIQFEELKPQHIHSVLDIYMHYVLNTTATFHARTLSLKDMQEMVLFGSSVYKTFVMTHKGELCGYVILGPYKKREAYNGTAEVTVYLRHDKTGCGMGSRAVRFIEDYARTKGIHVLIATICGENSRSIRLFEKNGYEKCAHYKEVGRKFGKLLDVVAYQKILEL